MPSIGVMSRDGEVILIKADTIRYVGRDPVGNGTVILIEVKLQDSYEDVRDKIEHASAFEPALFAVA